MQTVEKQYPNAGPKCDYRRYRTGESPQIGDRVQAWVGEYLLGKTSDVAFEINVVRRISPNGCISDKEQCGMGGWDPARFDLISRAVPSPAESPASGGGEGDEAEDNEGNVYCVSNPMGLPDAAVITKPGKYRSGAALIHVTHFDKRFGCWVGVVDGFVRTAFAWHPNGDIHSACGSVDPGWRIDGPFE